MSIEQALQNLADAINRNTAAGLKINQGRTENIQTEAPVEAKAVEADDTAAEKKAAAARKAKAVEADDTAAEKKAAAARKAKAADEDLDEDDTPVEPKTMTDVREIAIALRDGAGKEALEQAKKAFKIKAVKELGEENYAPFCRHCQNLIDEAEEV